METRYAREQQEWFYPQAPQACNQCGIVLPASFFFRRFNLRRKNMALCESCASAWDYAAYEQTGCLSNDLLIDAFEARHDPSLSVEHTARYAPIWSAMDRLCILTCQFEDNVWLNGMREQVKEHRESCVVVDVGNEDWRATLMFVAGEWTMTIWDNATEHALTLGITDTPSESSGHYVDSFRKIDCTADVAEKLLGAVIRDWPLLKDVPVRNLCDV